MADSDALQYRRAGLQVHGTVAASHAGTHARTGDTQSVLGAPCHAHELYQLSSITCDTAVPKRLKSCGLAWFFSNRTMISSGIWFPDCAPSANSITALFIYRVRLQCAALPSERRKSSRAKRQPPTRTALQNG